MPIASCKNKIPTLFAMFLFRVRRMISPTPAPVDNPATSAGKDSAPVVKSSTSKTDDAQFGIKPKTQAIAICTKMLLVRIVVKISSVKKPIKRFITKVATKI